MVTLSQNPAVTKALRGDVGNKKCSEQVSPNTYFHIFI
jgi:hypothetical protein